MSKICNVLNTVNIVSKFSIKDKTDCVELVQNDVTGIGTNHLNFDNDYSVTMKFIHLVLHIYKEKIKAFGNVYTSSICEIFLSFNFDQRIRFDQLVRKMEEKEFEFFRSDNVGTEQEKSGDNDQKEMKNELHDCVKEMVNLIARNTQDDILSQDKVREIVYQLLWSEKKRFGLSGLRAVVTKEKVNVLDRLHATVMNNILYFVKRKPKMNSRWQMTSYLLSQFMRDIIGDVGTKKLLKSLSILERLTS